jgi:hypothetical protein
MLLLFFIASLLMLPYFIVYYPLVNFKNLLFVDIYETRFLFIDNSHPFFGYTYSILSKVIIPILLLYAFETKRYIWLFLLSLYLIFLFLCGAHKSVFVGLLVLFVFRNINYKLFINHYYSILFASTIVAIGLAEWFDFDKFWIYLHCRVMFIPMILDMSFYDVFNNNNIYWSYSVLKGIFDYPYSQSPEIIIGEYVGLIGTYANNGVISDGLKNAGFWGVIINSFIVSFYFLILNNLKINQKFLGIFIILVFTFVSNPLPIVLLTNGGVFLLVCAYYYMNFTIKKIR